MLGIGTAAFGMNYGLTNRAGQVKFDEVVRILAFMAENSIEVLDTASSYGNAEKIIGKAIKEVGWDDFKVVSKGNPLDFSLYNTLEDLGVEEIYGLLVHSAEDLTDEAYEQLLRYKKAGIVEKIGVSVYTPEEAFSLTNQYSLDIIQLPINLLNQSCLEAVHFLKDREVEVHARSIFLQGLILTPPQNLLPYFGPLSFDLNFMWEYAEEVGLTTMELAVAFIQSLPVELPIVGVTSLDELKEIYGAMLKIKPEIDFAPFRASSERLDPRRWP